MWHFGSCVKTNRNLSAGRVYLATDVALSSVICVFFLPSVKSVHTANDMSITRCLRRRKWGMRKSLRSYSDDVLIVSYALSWHINTASYRGNGFWLTGLGLDYSQHVFDGSETADFCDSRGRWILNPLLLMECHAAGHSQVTRAGRLRVCVCVFLGALFYRAVCVINCGTGQVRWGQWRLSPLFVFLLFLTVSGCSLNGEREKRERRLMPKKDYFSFIQ